MFKNIHAIITDIEGTCTSLSFVKDTLFPYSHVNMASFIADHAEDKDIAPLLQQVAQQMKNEQATPEQLVAQLRQWIKADLKIPALKALQGHQWQKGYDKGDFHGHLYQDAYQVLKHWRDSGIKLYVYSSGSVKAQKLLFSHTEYGDISGWFSGFFDTAIGGKTDADAYHRISQEIGYAPQHLLFLSDVLAELDAANKSGMQVACLQRDQEQPCNYFIAKDFSEIIVESN